MIEFMAILCEHFWEIEYKVPINSGSFLKKD